jgi:hypothetical protein
MLLRAVDSQRRWMDDQRRRSAVRTRRVLGVLVVVMLAVAGVAVAEVAFSGDTSGTSAAPPSSTDAPTVAVSSVSTPTSSPPPKPPPPMRPPRVRGLTGPPAVGNGRWVPVERWASGPPAVFLTTFRPDRADPSTTAYAAWFRSSHTQLALYPGYQGPGPSTLPRGPEMVPWTARRRLLATFNSGFYEADSAGGFYVHRELFHPMIRGLATVVQYRDGRVDVLRWDGGARPGANIVVARQNLPLFVDRGRANRSLDVSERWGLTLHGAPAVWRTALAVDRSGNLIYLAAANQTAPSLAKLLIRVGAVRGMQLDINPEWPILVTYAGPGAAAPRLFVPNPNQVPTRFLYSSTKDFFAIYTRHGAPVTTPW